MSKYNCPYGCGNKFCKVSEKSVKESIKAKSSKNPVKENILLPKKNKQ